LQNDYLGGGVAVEGEGVRTPGGTAGFPPGATSSGMAGRECVLVSGGKLIFELDCDTDAAADGWVWLVPPAQAAAIQETAHNSSARPMFIDSHGRLAPSPAPPRGSEWHETRCHSRAPDAIFQKTAS